jgi:hypothetical protein
MSEAYQNQDIDGSARRADPHAMLLADLADFVTRRRPCGQLTGDATEPAANGYMVTVACSCGVVFLRWVTPEEAMRELVVSAFRRCKIELKSAEGRRDAPRPSALRRALGT